MEPLPGVFDVLQYFEMILPLVVALLKAYDVTNNGRHLGRNLGFYQELEIRLKPREMVFFVLNMKKKNMNKHFA